MNTYQKSILPNGLSVITSENKSSDIATISFWVMAGSRYESPNMRGCAHFLEHMLLKGSKKFPSAFKIGAILDRTGALSNAVTGPERIYLFIKSAKNGAEKMFELLADIVLNPLIEDKALATEKSVIIQEIRRAADNNPKRVWTEAYKKIFKGHPIANDPLGDEDFIAKATAEDLRNYHKKFFVPNRSAIIVSGGLSHNEILKLSKKFFDKQEVFSASDNLKPFFPNFADRRLFIKQNTAQYNLVFDFPHQAVDIKELAAFEIIKNYLSYGQSSMLQQELRQKRGLVYSMSANSSAYRDAGLFSIETATTKPKETAQIVLRCINNLKKNFNQKIFGELKNQTLNIIIRQMSDPLFEIQFLGKFWHLFHNQPAFPFAFFNAVKNCVYEDTLTVGTKYLTEKNLFTAILGGSDFNLP